MFFLNNEILLSKDDWGLINFYDNSINSETYENELFYKVSKILEEEDINMTMESGMLHFSLK